MDNDQQQAAANSATSQDDQEWDNALSDYQETQGISPKELPKDDKTQEDGGKDDTEAIENKTGKPVEETQEDQQPDNSAFREARSMQQQIVEDRQAMIDDVRSEMFSDIPEEILDADGDPIRTIEDAMKLANPNAKTEEYPNGRPLTEEEAARWLMQAQQKLNQRRDEAKQNAEAIADVNLSLRDQADNIRSKWGEVLKANPGLAKDLQVEFKKTLTLDEKTSIITKAPVSMERFYDIALKGYGQAQEQQKASGEVQAQAKKQVDRAQKRNDREDLFSGGKTQDQSPEDQEWSDAFKEYYNNK